MSKMVTVAVEIEVPTERLREEKFYHSAAKYRKCAEEAVDLTWKINHLASAALIEARDALPPPPKPVTKNTEWNTPIVSEAGTTATFIGPHPTNQRRFIALVYGTLLPLRYDWWFEAEPDPEPEPKWVPVEVGQKRRHPNTGEVCPVMERRTVAGLPAFKIGWGATSIIVPEFELERWEVVE